MLVYAVGKTEIKIPDTELFCLSTIHVKTQLELFECPRRTVCHADGDMPVLSAIDHTNLLYAPVNIKTAYTTEASSASLTKPPGTGTHTPKACLLTRQSKCCPQTKYS